MQIAMLQVHKDVLLPLNRLLATGPQWWPHFCHACATGQEIYTEVNDKLEMSQIAQQKMQAKLLSCQAIQILRHWENQYVSMAYRENIGVWEDLEILNDFE